MKCVICKQEVEIPDNGISSPLYGLTAHVECVRNFNEHPCKEDAAAVGHEVVENLRERGLMTDER